MSDNDQKPIVVCDFNNIRWGYVIAGRRRNEDVSRELKAGDMVIASDPADDDYDAVVVGVTTKTIWLRVDWES